MRNIKLDSILLFILVVPFIMTYRLSPGETPYWLFGLIFLLVLLNIVVDIIDLSKKRYIIIKRCILIITIVLVIGSAFIASIIVRHQTVPIYGVHDILLQQESAIRFLLHGKNPYAVTYFGTPLEQWNFAPHEVNPALYHFVMEPFYILFAIPFYLISTRTIGFFDGRIPLLFLLTVSILVGFLLPKDEEKKRLFATLLAFNPAMLPYTLEGRSDIFMFGFFALSLFALQRKKHIIASVFLALAFAVKQSIWFIFPFYVFYLLLKLKDKAHIIKSITFFAIVFSLITVPFFIWDSKAFIDSTISYLSGTTSHSYPVSGYGFGKLLNSTGVIKDTHAYYPFYIWQIVFALPVLGFLLYLFKKKPSVSKMVLFYGIFLFVYWYFSRYFNNSHVAYLTLVFTTAYFSSDEVTQ